MNSFKTHPFIFNRCKTGATTVAAAKSTAAEGTEDNAAVATGTGTSAAMLLL
jgi:hypothetical protein